MLAGCVVVAAETFSKQLFLQSSFYRQRWWLMTKPGWRNLTEVLTRSVKPERFQHQNNRQSNQQLAGHVTMKLNTCGRQVVKVAVMSETLVLLKYSSYECTKQLEQTERALRHVTSAGKQLHRWHGATFPLIIRQVFVQPAGKGSSMCTNPVPAGQGPYELACRQYSPIHQYTPSRVLFIGLPIIY